jgi:starvation-inducible DNA-binding protein
MAFKREILTGDSKKQVAGALQKVLVDLVDLSLQLKQAHWNVQGEHFRPLHLQLDEIIGTAREAGDEVAERLTTLGVAADGRLATVSKNSALEAYPPGFIGWQQTVGLVADRLMAAINRARASMEVAGEHDPVSEDLLIKVSGDLEKHLWMVQAQEETM